MEEKICFIQFIHPGVEHHPDDPLNKNWNKKDHRRKFIKQAGTYLTGTGIENGEMLFWGEWEPESKAHRIGVPISKHGPHFIYEPYYVVPESYRGIQNTDPFVFGERFLYTLCQQRKRKNATRLRHLEKGSVILFGSCIEKKAFVLDTVFVVGDCHVDHCRSDYHKQLAGKISKDYEKITICPMYEQSYFKTQSCAPDCSPSGEEVTWRLYFGANYDNKVNGMFSFFPCQPYKAESRGFERPKISVKDKDIIRNRLNQGFCIAKDRHSLDSVKDLWNQVKRQVEDQDLALGVYAKMPERRSATSSRTLRGRL